MNAWLIRSGQFGERDNWALENGLAGGGWTQVPSLEACKSREDISEVLFHTYPGEKPAAIRNYVNQLWALKGRVKVGDIVVMPMKSTRTIAIGRCISEYLYIADGQPSERHAVKVKWEKNDIARSSIKEDLLFSLGAFLTVCSIERNDAVWRLEQVLLTGLDPGSRQASGQKTPAFEDEEIELAGQNVDVELVARDSIRAFLLENFLSTQLEELVSEILVAHGYVCSGTKRSGDAGIDIIAGRGTLGLDSPRIVAQCKSEKSQVGIDVVTRLRGTIQSAGAEQGLLVAYGGITRQAQTELEKNLFSIKVWNADDVVDELFSVYGKLSSEMRSRIPLKQVWTLVPRAE